MGIYVKQIYKMGMKNNAPTRECGAIFCIKLLCCEDRVHAFAEPFLSIFTYSSNFSKSSNVKLENDSKWYPWKNMCKTASLYNNTGQSIWLLLMSLVLHLLPIYSLFLQTSEVPNPTGPRGFPLYPKPFPPSLPCTLVYHSLHLRFSIFTPLFPQDDCYIVFLARF